MSFSLRQALFSLDPFHVCSGILHYKVTARALFFLYSRISWFQGAWKVRMKNGPCGSNGTLYAAVDPSVHLRTLIYCTISPIVYHISARAWAEAIRNTAVNSNDQE